MCLLSLLLLGHWGLILDGHQHPNAGATRALLEEVQKEMYQFTVSVLIWHQFAHGVNDNYNPRSCRAVEQSRGSTDDF